MAQAGDGKRRSEKRQKTKIIQRRVTPRQHENFESRARKAGFEDGNAMLDALIHGEVWIDNQQRASLSRLLGHFGKMGSNLNQIAYRVNSRQITALTPERNTLAEIREEIEELANEVRKALRP